MKKKKSIPSNKARQSAIQLNSRLEKMRKQYKIYIDNEQYLSAIQLLKQTQIYAPNHAKIWTELGYCYLRSKQYELSRTSYLKALELRNEENSEDTNLYDGLTESCHFVDDMEGVKKYGQLAIKSKLKLVKEIPAIEKMQTPPPIFKADAKINVISFSLFGSSAKYCETAILNVKEAKNLFPEWTCRFYCDETVPQQVRERIAQEGGQVIMVSDTILKKMGGLFWRFLVIDDPQVERFLIRDADSVVSTREQYAVKQWLESDRWFHIMRDSFSHTELILAGMWGGVNGIIQNIEDMISNYIETGNYLTRRVMDQHFLRYCVWPIVSQNVWHHDSQFALDETHVFPSHPVRENYEKLPNYHIGCNISAHMEIHVDDAKDGQPVTWRVKDQDGKEICCYAGVVKNGRCAVDVPRPYTEQILAKKWKVITQMD